METHRLLFLPGVLKGQLEPRPLIEWILLIDRVASGTMHIQPQICVQEDDSILFRALLYRVISGCNKCTKSSDELKPAVYTVFSIVIFPPNSFGQRSSLMDFY